MQKDPDDFANSVIAVLSSEDKRRRVGEEGVKVVRRRFDWDIIALTLEGYFEEIAKIGIGN